MTPRPAAKPFALPRLASTEQPPAPFDATPFDAAPSPLPLPSSPAGVAVVPGAPPGSAGVPDPDEPEPGGGGTVGAAVSRIQSASWAGEPLGIAQLNSFDPTVIAAEAGGPALPTATGVMPTPSVENTLAASYSPSV